MTAKQIDNYIMECPYFCGKDTIDRTMVNGEYVHIGACRMEWHHRKICPSSVCLCAETLGLNGKERNEFTDLR